MEHISLPAPSSGSTQTLDVSRRQGAESKRNAIVNSCIVANEAKGPEKYAQIRENFPVFFEDKPIHDLLDPVLCSLCSEHGTRG